MLPKFLAWLLSSTVQMRRDMADLPLFRSIGDTLGNGVWYNTVLVLTHGAAPPPDGNQGQMTHEVYSHNRGHLLQQTIRIAAGDQRVMNLVTAAENHPACRTNAEGQPILPSGMAWKPHMLLTLLSSKLLSDADELLAVGNSAKVQAAAMQSLMRGQKMPPLTYLVNTMIAHKGVRHQEANDQFCIDDNLI